MPAPAHRRGGGAVHLLAAAGAARVSGAAEPFTGRAGASAATAQLRGIASGRGRWGDDGAAAATHGAGHRRAASRVESHGTGVAPADAHAGEAGAGATGAALRLMSPVCR